jgi:hypothetical protein
MLAVGMQLLILQTPQLLSSLAQESAAAPTQ